MEITATEFKAKCLRLPAKVGATREPFIITKRDKPVAKVVPVEQEGQSPNHFGYMAGTLTIGGNIVSPTTEDWEAALADEAHFYEQSAPESGSAKDKK